MLKANGYFTFGNNNSYLLIILMTFILFSCFCCAFMASNVWASEKLLNLASFLVLDALQAVFVGLSLFVQKASVS
jgi:isoprenylcysteine carboxyl methyltransferase (ICMT) family protein YpbQ